MTRLALAGGFGLLAWAFIVALTALRVVVNPGVWERVTSASLAWALGYAALFALAGALCERLSRLPARAVRYVLVGAVVGALLWSFLNVTWAFTGSAHALVEPPASALEAAFTGAVLGAAGGLLFLVLALLRRH